MSLPSECDKIAASVPPSSPYSEAVDHLRKIARLLTQSFGHELQFSLVPTRMLFVFGFDVVRKQIFWKETLFRLHVPAEGFPVSLLLFADEDKTDAPDMEAMEKAIVGFLSEPINQVHLGWLRKQANKEEV